MEGNTFTVVQPQSRIKPENTRNNKIQSLVKLILFEKNVSMKRWGALRPYWLFVA